MTSRTITDAEMESRKRIARLNASITDALAKAADADSGITYVEVVAALLESANRMTMHLWREELKEPTP